MGVDGQPHPPVALPRQRESVPILEETGFQGRPGAVRKILHSPGLDPRTVQPVASSYNYYSIPTH
jgi:hypothetical protein